MYYSLKVVMVGSYPFQHETGPSVHIKNLIKNLSIKKDIELHLISKGRQNHVYKMGHVIIYTLKKGKYYPLNEIVYSIKVRKIINKIKPDIVHMQVLAPYSFFISRYKKIFTIHGLFYEESRYRFKGFNFLIFGIPRILNELILLKKEKFFIAVSDHIKHSISNHSNALIHTIPNGIDENFFNNNQNYDINNNVLYVASIEPRKGLLILIKAINKILIENPSIRLIVVGNIIDKKYYEKIIKYINLNNINNNIIFKGYISRKNLLDEYKKCTIFVLPSKIEPFGIVILEAMASGKPVIASNTGGIPTIIKNGYNGLLFDGSVIDLTNKIKYLLYNKKIRTKIANNGFFTAKDYEWSTISNKTYNYYNLIMNL